MSEISEEELSEVELIGDEEREITNKKDPI